MSARSFAVLCVLVLTALLAASCSSSSDSTNTDTPDTPFVSWATENPGSSLGSYFPDESLASLGSLAFYFPGVSLGSLASYFPGVSLASLAFYFSGVSLGSLAFYFSGVSLGSLALGSFGSGSGSSSSASGSLGSGSFGSGSGSSGSGSFGSGSGSSGSGSSSSASGSGTPSTTSPRSASDSPSSGTGQTNRPPPFTDRNSQNDNADASPVLAESKTPDMPAIVAGGEHSCALREGGTISCWGANGSGQLGDGTGGADGDRSLVPVDVAGIFDAVDVAAGDDHSCALRQGGTISCWGANGSGQLGDGTGGADGDRSLVPVDVAGIFDAVDVAAGDGYSCALRQGGTISCWGANWFGQLGDGIGGIDGIFSLVPVLVAGIFDALALAAGGAHSCALRQGGAISCWGANWFGQLGDGTGGADGDFSLEPVDVAGVSDAVDVAAGDEHSCALRQGGTISCWGANSSGQLGDGTGGADGDRSLVNVDVAGVSDAVDVAAGGGFSCALRESDTISCWGSNEDGQLGDGVDGDFSSVPVDVAGVSDALALAAGDGYSCALRESGDISCWGANSSGQLGDGTSDDLSSVPVGVEGVSDAVTVAAGGGGFDGHSCALREGGDISCWGWNGSGQLGDGTGDRSLVPVGVAGVSDAVAVAAGGGHSCALREGGTVSCWGDNWSGQLGDGTGGADGDFSLVPVGVMGISDAVAVAAGGAHSCALREGGTVSCWGDNSSGQLGDGNSGDFSLVPVGVAGISDAVAVVAGSVHSCALREGGTISCWGHNGVGQLGDGTGGNLSDRSLVPVGVVGISDAVAVAAGGGHSCALREGGTISCWGGNWFGELGDGTGDDFSLVPVGVVGISDAVTVAAGWGHSCALREGGTISCWGDNQYGQLGDGTGGADGDLSLVPVGVAGVSDAVAVAAGGGYSCALREGGAISCWGSNRSGQLGDGWRVRFVVGFGG